ncbi:hypothetical protein [Noviherbaspirillum galbum]|uniref:Flagellar protein FliL n=1 Tax=Noviherbaspirillum galbum TaxID=2709383 RepID=A0A6B3SVP8_9BURK|nr:hypothetical protein [Noviherbaspirillum galbum]NEX63465.1 hypothetical protein [Noviherbaspirillum galbum]
MSAKPVLKSVSRPAAKPAARPQRSIGTLIGATALVLVVGFAATWFYLKRGERLESERVYSKPREVTLATKDYSMAATFAVRTNGKYAEWAGSNGKVMEDIFKEALMMASPRRLLSPEGMREFQGSVRAAINRRTEAGRVQEVLVTDFLYTSDVN